MIGQMYQIKVSEETINRVVPGAFVMQNNYNEDVIGFIWGETNDHMVICLFEPTELPPNGILIHESVDKDVIYSKLVEIFNNDPLVKEIWCDLL